MVYDTIPQDLRISRRRLLAGAVALGAGAAVLKGGARPVIAAPEGPKHLVWVWQFSTDAEPHLIGQRLLDHNMGILLKTHDGLEWMSEYDKSRYAVSGPAQVRTLVNYYEPAGVPFHAWAVVRGEDPVREARMAADVLAAGARSIYLDLEPHSGFWRGSAADAEAFGRELRRLQPNGHVVLSVDPRPWVLERLPMREFAAIANEIAPQQYWRTFNTPANYERFAQSGYPVGPEGVTPEFLHHVTNLTLAPYGLPITHVGQGATPETDEWRRFIDLAYATGSRIVTVWRFGVTTPDIFSLLRNTPPRVPVPPASAVYVVQPGDTLGRIAGAHSISLQSIVEANGITDVNYLYVGQQLVIPGVAPLAASTAPAAAPISTGGSARSHTVEPGDTLSGIASRFGSSVGAIAEANGLADPGMIYVGQTLVVP